MREKTGRKKPKGNPNAGPAVSGCSAHFYSSKIPDPVRRPRTRTCFTIGSAPGTLPNNVSGLSTGKSTNPVKTLPHFAESLPLTPEKRSKGARKGPGFPHPQNLSFSDGRIRWRETRPGPPQPVRDVTAAVPCERSAAVAWAVVMRVSTIMVLWSGTIIYATTWEFPWSYSAFRAGCPDIR
jgi:hypothetical protein